MKFVLCFFFIFLKYLPSRGNGSFCFLKLEFILYMWLWNEWLIPFYTKYLQAEMTLKQIESLSPPIMKQVLPLVEQLPPLYMDLVKGREDFTPKPEETRRLVCKISNFFVPRLLHYTFLFIGSFTLDYLLAYLVGAWTSW